MVESDKKEYFCLPATEGIGLGALLSATLLVDVVLRHRWFWGLGVFVGRHHALNIAHVTVLSTAES